jgi:hypothetical protein
MIQKNNFVLDLVKVEKILVKAIGMFNIFSSFIEISISGGPLMSTYNQTWQIIGITSYGEGCARANKPGELDFVK